MHDTSEEAVVECMTRDQGLEPHRHHCVVSLSKNINPSLVLVQPRKTRPFITERLLMGRKESNQTNNQSSEDGIFMNYSLYLGKSVLNRIVYASWLF